MPSLLTKLRSDIKRDQTVLANKRRYLRNPEVRKALAVLGRLAGKANVTYSNYYGTRGSVSINMEELQSFKTGVLPKLLEKMLEAGVKFTSTSDWPESGNRTFSGRIGGVPLDISVSATLSEVSKACSVKVIGEVTETRPKYQIICD